MARAVDFLPSVLKIRQSNRSTSALLLRKLLQHPVPAAQTGYGGAQGFVFRRHGKLGNDYLQVVDDLFWLCLCFVRHARYCITKMTTYILIHRETALLFDPVKSSESDKQRVATVVAHELAHQW